MLQEANIQTDKPDATINHRSFIVLEKQHLLGRGVKPKCWKCSIWIVVSVRLVSKCRG